MTTRLYILLGLLLSPTMSKSQWIMSDSSCNQYCTPPCYSCLMYTGLVKESSLEYSVECNCNCKQCSGPKECCSALCPNCADTTEAPKLVFIPYPYPINVPVIYHNPSSETTRIKSEIPSSSVSPVASTVTTVKTPSTRIKIKLMKALESFEEMEDSCADSVERRLYDYALDDVQGLKMRKMLPIRHAYDY